VINHDHILLSLPLRESDVITHNNDSVIEMFNLFGGMSAE
jgi:hypothetical protein